MPSSSIHQDNTNGAFPTSGSSLHTPAQPPRTPIAARRHRSTCWEDSPLKLRLTHSPGYQDGVTDSMRKTVIEDLGNAIPQIGLAAFMENLLPPLKDGINASKVVSILGREALSVNASLCRVLKYFEARPSKRMEHEDQVFAPLAGVCEKMCHVASQILDEETEQTLSLALLPNFAPKSDRASSTRPDAFFGLKNKIEDFVKVMTGKKDETTEEKKAREKAKKDMKMHGKDIQWYDIAVPFEFRKKDIKKNRDENVEKVVFHKQQIMALDPRRRFTFGVTIEDTQMRLWFCSRSDLVVSEPFNFTTDVECLCHIFLSFAFASEVELGWDSTIQPVIIGEEERGYHIQVGDRTYVTDQVLSEVAADGLLSSGTRVWRVTDIGSKETGVLKDVWVEETRRLEHEIHEKLLSDVEEMYNPDIRQRVASHLLTPITHCLVQADGEEDHTLNVMMRGYVLPLDGVFDLKAKQPRKVSGRRGTGPPGANDRDIFERQPQKKKLEEYTRRRHYRIVFREAANPIHTVTMLSHAFVVLKDCAECLRWIHGSGWMHRDISAGNLYYYRGRGLIGDLEYARRRNSSGVHKMRTGSADFVSIEAARQMYLFRGAGQDLKIEDSENDGDDVSVVRFILNGLHDLESLWWIAIYELFMNYDGAELPIIGDGAENRDRDRHSAAVLIFPSTSSTEHRELFLRSRNYFLSKLAWMSRSLKEVKLGLNELRAHLVESYQAFEAKLPNAEWDAFDGAQEVFRGGFKKCEGSVSGIRLVLCKTSGFQLLDDENIDQETVGEPSPFCPDGSDEPTPESATHEDPVILGSSVTARKRRSTNEDMTDMHGKRKRQVLLLTTGSLDHRTDAKISQGFHMWSKTPFAL